ncbi:MAG: tyrosine-type recombinase/integrase [Candidatus Omnitrophica bacterium]|nr:tyrosine-type recombinase/integrase [Candidatus Omnitrophota bacterium]
MPTPAPESPFKAFLERPLIQDWLNNTTSPNTRDAMRVDLQAFLEALKVREIDDFSRIQRSDDMEWRDSMAGTKENPGFATRSIKRKMSTVAKFFEYLCDQGEVKENPFLGVERPKLTANEGTTAAIGERQARDLLDAPDSDTALGKRDRAILATFLFHALRRSELCGLRLKDIQEREGIKQFKILGKGEKERYIPIHPSAARRINDYLEAIGNPADKELPIFRSLSNNGKNAGKALTTTAVYQLVLRYGEKVGIDISNFSPHSLRATAATNTLSNGEDIRRVQKWLGHATIQTTAMYDKRNNRPEDSPTYRVKY